MKKVAVKVKGRGVARRGGSGGNSGEERNMAKKLGFVLNQEGRTQKQPETSQPHKKNKGARHDASCL